MTTPTNAAPTIGKVRFLSKIIWWLGCGNVISMLRYGQISSLKLRCTNFALRSHVSLTYSWLSVHQLDPNFGGLLTYGVVLIHPNFVQIDLQTAEKISV